MTSDDSPVPAPAAEPLQFEHADFTAAPAAPVFGCSACAQPIADAYYEIHGQTLCAGCRDRVAAHFTGGSGLSRFVRAVMIGGLAAVAGTLIYFVVLAATGYQAALIAILVPDTHRALKGGRSGRARAHIVAGWPISCSPSS